MLFSKTTIDDTQHRFYYNHQMIEFTNEYKYLGVVFTSNGKMKFAAKQLPERARKAYYAIKANFPANNNFSVEIMLKLYQSMIVPIITYGSEMWISDFKCELMSSDQFPLKKHNILYCI